MMGPGSGTAPAEAPRPATGDAKSGPRPGRLTPAQALLLTLWLGLVAGFLDLGTLVFRAKLVEGEFYRLHHGFPWIIPAGVAALVMVPGALVALVAGPWGRGVPRALVLWPPALVAFLDLSAKLPFEFWSSLLLSAGLAVQYARSVGRHSAAVLRLARRTVPLLIGTILALALATSGVRAWSERRALAALPPPPPRAQSILLIVWDTVRAQNLSLHGYGRPTTPNLERLAARGVRFEHAFATAPWTLPSHASLFTGRWPHELSAGWKSPLDGTRPTLAESLRARGYDTAGFVANLDYCGRETGLARGFTHYEDYPLDTWEVLTRYVGLGRRLDRASIAMAASLLAGRRGADSVSMARLSKEHARRAGDIDRAFLDWLSWQRPRGRPFFAFLNYNDAHTPYEPPDGATPGFGLRPTTWRERIALLQWNNEDKLKLPPAVLQMGFDLYDDSIAHLDRRLGSLLDELARRGVLDETLVVVTSDHGEHLGDHGLFFHGCSLYRQLVEVPLVIVGPDGVPAGRSVAEPVSLRDLPATVLDLLGPAPAETAFPGRSLARFWGDPGAASPPAPLLMETQKPTLLTNQGREPAAKGPMKGLIAAGMHYIRSGDGREELYSLEADPEERHNLAGLPAVQATVARLRGLLPPERGPRAP